MAYFIKRPHTLTTQEQPSSHPDLSHHDRTRTSSHTCSHITRAANTQQPPDFPQNTNLRTDCRAPTPRRHQTDPLRRHCHCARAAHEGRAGPAPPSHPAAPRQRELARQVLGSCAHHPHSPRERARPRGARSAAPRAAGQRAQYSSRSAAGGSSHSFHSA